MVNMAGMPAIRKWVVCIAGFLQDEGTPGGLGAVWRELHRLHAAPTSASSFARGMTGPGRWPNYSGGYDQRKTARKS